jgi:hypothetical protein
VWTACVGDLARKSANDVASTRSEKVASGLSITAGTQTLYAVPAGWVFILKNFRWRMTTAVTPGDVVEVYLDSNGVLVRLAVHTFQTENYFSVDSWVVLMPGDTIVADIGCRPSHYWISGALLPDTPTRGT